MADIDLAAAYRDFADLMDTVGPGPEAYAIRITVWNHRHHNGKPYIYWTLTAMRGNEVYEQLEEPTLAEAFTAMRTRLERRRAPKPPMAELGTVAVPEEVVDGGESDIPF